MTNQTLLAVVALVPVSLLPVAAGYASPLYGLGAVILATLAVGLFGALGITLTMALLQRRHSER